MEDLSAPVNTSQGAFDHARSASRHQHAIEQAGSIDRDKVAAKLNAMDVTTFFGRDKFATGAGDHGLQIAHDMVLAQWQTRGGKLVKEMVWPDAAATAKVAYPIH